MFRTFFFSLLLIFLSNCKEKTALDIPSSEETSVSRTGGTEAMTDSIRRIISRVNFRKHPYESGERLKLIEQELATARANNRLPVQLYVEYGQTLLNAGKSAEAIEVFEEILRRTPENREITPTTKGLHEALAISYMRLGEQINCRDNHSTESCLFPIKGGGVHKDTNGSRKAIAIYERILEKFPDDLQSKWILNLAYMTLGEYPLAVPKQHLIPPKTFRSDYSIKPFENISMYLGLDVNELAGGVITDDFDNDGFLDIIVSSWGLFGKLHYFKNQGDGSFEDLTAKAGLDELTGGLNLLQADYNNDGHLDFFVCRGAWSGYSFLGQLPNSLLRNNGDGTFTDVTIASGLYAEHPTQTAVWSDFNLDGYIDLFVGNETHTTEELHASQLYINNGDGTFRDASAAAGLNFNRYVKGSTAGDINNDGLPDLYVSMLDGPNLLLLNTSSGGNISFSDISKSAGVEAPMESFPTWFFDYNNDGLEDIFVSCFDSYALKQQATEVAADYLKLEFSSDLPRLYKNLGDNRFKDVTTEVGLDHVLPTMGSNYGDLDNDGFPDFYLGTGAPDFRAIVPNRMYRNNRGNGFQDVTYAGNFGHIQKGHGVGFADLDNDGDQDVYAVMGGSVSGDIFQNALFENPGNSNNSITIRLVGKNSNRSAIGARIRVSYRDKSGNVSVYQTVNSGGSFGANSLQAEVGIGTATAVENIEVNWPDANNTFVSYGPAEAGSVLKIIEDNKTPEVVQPKKVTFMKSHMSGSH